MPIFKNEAGFSFRIYKRLWFSSTRGYSYWPNRMNHQDSLVIESKEQFYFKVYNAKNELMFEGLNDHLGRHFIGDVKFYARQGNLKRIEHWVSYFFQDSLGNYYVLSESEFAIRIVEFRKDGSEKKSIHYELLPIKGLTDIFEFHKIIERHKRNGIIRKKTILLKMNNFTT